MTYVGSGNLPEKSLASEKSQPFWRLGWRSKVEGRQGPCRDPGAPTAVSCHSAALIKVCPVAALGCSWRKVARVKESHRFILRPLLDFS